MKTDLQFITLELSSGKQDEKIRRVFEYRHWRHRIDLGGGLFTPGYISSQDWETIHLPASLAGESFLDIGSNDGLFSFEAERRGATKVMACDLYNADINSMKEGWRGEAIDMVKELKGSRIEVFRKGLYHIDEAGRKFDVVFCGDVLSWVNDVPLALQKLSDVTIKTLIIKDGFWKGAKDVPALKYEQNKPYVYKPNVSFMQTMLKKLGFTRIEFIPIDMQGYFERRELLYPRLKISAGTPLYDLPWEKETSRSSGREFTGMATAFYEEMFYVKELGWIREADVKPVEDQRSSLRKGFSRVYRSIFPRWRRRAYDQKSEYELFTIVATR